MATRTYNIRAIVLKKTKLGESDLIYTFLSEDGSQVRAVGKGARKPTSPFSSRLELYSVVDLLIHQGKSLDIVTEARLVTAGTLLRTDLCWSAAAAPMAELLEKVTQQDLVESRLFALTEKALKQLENSQMEKLPALTAAHLMKSMAFLGFRPSLKECVVCGSFCDEVVSDFFCSFALGGLVCRSCSSQVETQKFSSNTIEWLRALIALTFEEISTSDIDLTTAFELLQFDKQWIKQHAGVSLKSLDFLFTSGLYEDIKFGK